MDWSHCIFDCKLYLGVTTFLTISREPMCYLSCYRSGEDSFGNLKWKNMNPMKEVKLMKEYMRDRDYEKLMGLLKEVIVSLSHICVAYGHVYYKLSKVPISNLHVSFLVS